MNNKKLLSLISLLALVGCQSQVSSSIVSTSTAPISSSEVTSTTSSSSISSSSSTTSDVSSSSSVESSSSSSINSSTSSSSSSTSSSSSSTSSAPESLIVLDELQKGFVAKSYYTKTYNTNKPTPTLLKTFVGDGVARMEQYSGESWDNVTDETRPYKAYQYEKDANEDAQSITYNLNGDVIYTPMLLKDPIAGGNVEAFWSETNLDNAFARLDKSNFERINENTYELDLSTASLKDAEYKDAVIALARQMYMILEGSEFVGYHFIEQMLTSYEITVDENHVPVSYTAEFKKVRQPDGWGGQDTVYQEISGTFEKLGSDSITKATTLEKKYEDLDAALDILRLHNYEFDIVRNQIGDGFYTEDSVTTIKGKSDGLGNFEVEHKNTGHYTFKDEKFGYMQTGANTFRKYTEGEGYPLWNGVEKEGSALSMLPSFAFSSSVFTLDEEASTNGTSVYKLNKPTLINSEDSLDLSIINFGFDSIQGWSLNDVTITISENLIVFNNICSSERNMEAKFYNFGGVSEITKECKDPNELFAANYASDVYVKGNQINFNVRIQKDGVFAIEKDGKNYGSYGYEVNEKNEIVLDDKIETDSFTVTEKVNSGFTKNKFTCYFYKTVKLDNPFNPSSIILTVKVCEEGLTYGSDISITLDKVESSVEDNEDTKTLTYLKDCDDHFVQYIYYDLYDNGYGEKADYIPYIFGIENCVEIIWTEEFPEGFQYVIEDAPEDYLEVYLLALVNDYGYTKTSENIYVNEEVGLSIEVKEDMGYQQFYITVI